MCMKNNSWDDETSYVYVNEINFVSTKRFISAIVELCS